MSTSQPPEKLWIRGPDGFSTSVECSVAAGGKSRSTATMQWKQGRDGVVRSGRVTGNALPKSRVYG